MKMSQVAPVRSIFVVIDPSGEDGGPDAVYASTAQEAADMLVGSGAYDWAPLPPLWEQTQPQIIVSKDMDGMEYESQVWGPF